MSKSDVKPVLCISSESNKVLFAGPTRLKRIHDSVYWYFWNSFY
jgi:hypothetical protein